MVLYKNSFILLGNIQQQLTKVNWRSKISMFTTGSISEGWPSASHKRASPQFLSILGVSISSTDRESRGKYHKLHEWNTIINSHLSQVQGEKKKTQTSFCTVGSSGTNAQQSCGCYWPSERIRMWKKGRWWKPKQEKRRREKIRKSRKRKEIKKLICNFSFSTGKLLCHFFRPPKDTDKCAGIWTAVSLYVRTWFPFYFFWPETTHCYQCATSRAKW